MASGRKVTGAIRYLVDSRSLQLECARLLHEALLMPVLLYGSETMMWTAKKKSRIGRIDGKPLRFVGYYENG